MTETFPCPYCNATRFRTAADRYNHARAKHIGMPLRDLMTDEMRQKRDEHAARQRDDAMREPSLAEIAIGASLKRAMGEQLDPLEESLLP